jgi:hypothetical protein
MSINYRIMGLGLAANLAWAMAMTFMLSPLARSVQLRDGTVYFVKIPQLGDVRAVYNDVRIRHVPYYFTVTHPEGVGEPLQRLTFSQEGFDQIQYSLSRTWAYANGQRQQRIPLGEVSGDRQGTITVNFEPAVSPGTTVTIGLQSRRNPSTGGVYLFGVTAFPPGEKAHGQFLGYGRITFFDSGDNRP